MNALIPLRRIDSPQLQYGAVTVSFSESYTTKLFCEMSEARWIQSPSNSAKKRFTFSLFLHNSRSFNEDLKF